IYMGGEEVAKNLFRELRAMMGAPCPYVVTMHNAYLRDGTLFLLLEYMPLGNMDSFVKKCTLQRDALGMYIYL
ncbi:hypothetical protein KIPB_016319, partial [Kipferlia bialata]